jgi:hypothetical protein
MRGAGNGQAAQALAETFDRVVATDLSAEQIARTTAHPRITYRATPDFEIRVEWTLPDLLAYLRTCSPTQRCLKETGTDPTLTLAAKLE